MNNRKKKLVELFGILKDKLKKAVKSISEKFEKKEEAEPKVEVEIKKEEAEHPMEELKLTPEPEDILKEVVEEKEKREEIPEIEEPLAEEIKPEVVEEAKKEIVEEKPKQPTHWEVEVEEPEKKGFFRRIVEKVVKPVVKRVVEKKLSEQDVEPILKDLEEGLIESDVAFDVAEKIVNDLKKNLVDREIKRGGENKIVVESFKNSLMEILNVPSVDLIEIGKEKKPLLVVFFGFNGSGKTTSLAKVGKWLMDNGHSVIFAAADTFRAAAEEQLEEHAAKIGVRVIKHQYGADPAAVIFDSVEHAKANGIDFILADTAGRAHTNRNLMDQMQKIVRVNKPDLKILVIDSLTGNDAMIQARMYGEVGVDGLIFTKVDVNEKGGAILSVTHELKKPILFIGTGQKYNEFLRFDAQNFVNNILS